MRPLIGIINIRRYAVRIFPCIVTEQVLILLFTGSENNKLGILRTNFFNYIINQIKALLICQTGDNTNHKLSVILCQPQFLLKTSLVFNLFLAESTGIIIGIDERIR